MSILWHTATKKTIPWRN